jgi:ATP-dependent Clp protease ATP-binding subunit ClpA
VPFLPFSLPEAAVIAHKYVLELKRKVAKSVKVSGMLLVGRVMLDIRRDGAICKMIASDGYDPDQGARSLKSSVESRVEDELVQTYLEEEGQIHDSQEMISFAVQIARNGTLSVNKVAE